MNVKHTRTITLFSVAAFLTVTSVFAGIQQKGFSGNWIIDEGASSPLGHTMGPLASGSTPGIPDVTQIEYGAQKLVIRLKTADPQKRSIIEQQTFMLDGQKRIVHKDSVFIIKAKAYKAGTKIIVETERHDEMSLVGNVFYAKDTFEVSEDGNILIIKREKRHDAGTMTFNFSDKPVVLRDGGGSDIETETLVFRRQ